jgi:hypothetical protein
MADNAFQGATQRASQMPASWRHPGLGLEVLDELGIDIDQDPRAFAKFLEMRKLIQARAARRTLRVHVRR